MSGSRKVPTLFEEWFRLVLVVASLLLAGCATPTSPAPRVAAGLAPAQTDLARRNLRVFDAAWDLVNRKYYDAKFQDVNWKAAALTYGPKATAAADDETLYRTINEMIGLLQDSHTHALAPARAEERRSRQRARTGFSLLNLENRWVVTEVVPASPAQLAGVKPGWLVLSRNGHSLDERMEFHPQEGELTQWEFLDGADRPVRLSLVARLISTVARQEMRVLDGGVVYLRFDEFSYACRRWLHAQLRTHRDAPSLVIDLRNNPGGGTFWLREMIGEFFDKKVEVGKFTRRDGVGDDANSWQLGSVHYRGRVVLLTSGGSASAAEIFSAVLQERHRAVIVGQKTMGAVLASRFYSLPEGGQLQLSVEDYVTPAGRRLEGEKGSVDPDVVTESTLADVRAGRDRGLETALQVLARPAK